MSELNLARYFVDFLVNFASGLIVPVMMLVFVGGVALRLLVQYTVKREEWFAKEFDKRIHRFMEQDKGGSHSFYVLTKRLLEQTFYELFEIRGIMKRRKMDYIMSPSDRIFLIQEGSARIVRDTLKQVKFLRYDEQHPKFLEISKSVFQNNPCFNRVFGWIPIAPATDFLNALPGLFVVGGIFGTFLGIMRALPELGGMNLNDVEGSKQIMDAFLLKVSFSMSASVTGIFLSVCIQVIDIMISPEQLYVEIVNRYELALEYLWRRCDNNVLPENIPNFDEHRDPVEATAEFAVMRELARADGVTQDRRRPPKEKDNAPISPPSLPSKDDEQDPPSTQRKAS
jgi:hypothetical protein